jgi:hypothetical protein
MDWFSYFKFISCLKFQTHFYQGLHRFYILVGIFFQTLFGFNVSGHQNLYSLIEFKIAKPNLINGGLFGFEGSIFCTLIQFILITATLIYYNKSVSSSKQTKFL